MDTCKACNGIFDRSEKFVVCSGLCGKVFHPGCAGLNVTNFKAWTANVGLLWFCDVCRVNFNPIVMDREAVIIKTMRDLLLRVDSMDLRVGQLGENLKTLSSVLSMPGPTRRESNISSRFQRFLASGTTMNDSAEFFNSIDRLNLDSSLLSNVANNTVADDDDPANLTSVLLTSNANSCTATITSSVTTAATSTVATATTAATTTAATATAVPATATTAATYAAAAATATVVSAAATTATATTAATTTAAAATASATATTAAAAIFTTATTPRVSTASTIATTTIPAAVASTSSGHRRQTVPPTDDTCRLRVVSKNRPRSQRESTESTLKSFYVTPFHNAQTAEDIVEYLRDVTNIENSRINCVKLVPRNKNIEECTFVSFKVSVSEDLVPTVSDPFYWPEGVEVREFQPKNENSQNLIKPA